MFKVSKFCQNSIFSAIDITALDFRSTCTVRHNKSLTNEALNNWAHDYRVGHRNLWIRMITYISVSGKAQKLTAL